MGMVSWWLVNKRNKAVSGQEFVFCVMCLWAREEPIEALMEALIETRSLRKGHDGRRDGRAQVGWRRGRGKGWDVWGERGLGKACDSV